MSFAREINRRVWDERARRRKNHTLPVTEADFQKPGPVINPFGWVGDDVRGQRVLCLAAGGGRHGALYAAAGAVVTVVDISPQMLELDRQLAAERGLRLTLIEASMEDLSGLPEAGFDLVIQPVSTCYVPDVMPVYRQVARVTAAGGLYISQHKQPASLQAEIISSANGCFLSTPCHTAGPLPPVTAENEVREAGAVEFLHRWEDLLGGLCRSGFVLEDLAEPRPGTAPAEPGTFAHRSQFLPPYVAFKARRTAQMATAAASPQLWTP